MESKKQLRQYFQLFQDPSNSWENGKFNSKKVTAQAVLIGIIVSPIAIAINLLGLVVSPISKWLSKD